jgi:hypothetical protein
MMTCSAGWVFSLPWGIQRSKEAPCAVRAVGLRIPRGPNSASSVLPLSRAAVRAAGLRICPGPSSALSAALPSLPSLNHLFQVPGLKFQVPGFKLKTVRSPESGVRG